MSCLRRKSLKPSSERTTKSISYATSGSASGTATSPRGGESSAKTEFQMSKNVQARFETVWRKLRMSTTQKLNAAAKYSSDHFINILDKVASFTGVKCAEVERNINWPKPVDRFS